MPSSELAKAREYLRQARKLPKGELVCSDDCICPAGLIVEFAGVTRVDPVLVCTLPDGHDGYHVAQGYVVEGATSDVIATWPRGAGRAG